MPRGQIIRPTSAWTSQPSSTVGAGVLGGIGVGLVVEVTGSVSIETTGGSVVAGDEATSPPSQAQHACIPVSPKSPTSLPVELQISG